MPLCRTYASLDILDGGSPHLQHTAFPYPVDQPNPFSVSPTEVTEVLPHSAHYRSQLSPTTVLSRTPVASSFSRQRSQLYPTTVLFRTPVASLFSRQSSPLGPYQSSLPDRPIFPRSKSSPSLYRNTLIHRFKRSSRGREFFHRKKISSVTDTITKPKNGGGLQVPAAIPTGVSCIVAAGVDWEVVDGMA
jgi:hypothetical protein